jgi:hypothetical protein
VCTIPYHAAPLGAAISISIKQVEATKKAMENVMTESVTVLSTVYCEYEHFGGGRQVDQYDMIRTVVNDALKEKGLKYRVIAVRRFKLALLVELYAAEANERRILRLKARSCKTLEGTTAEVEREFSEGP